MNVLVHKGVVSLESIKICIRRIDALCFLVCYTIHLLLSNISNISNCAVQYSKKIKSNSSRDMQELSKIYIPKSPSNIKVTLGSISRK